MIEQRILNHFSSPSEHTSKYVKIKAFSNTEVFYKIIFFSFTLLPLSISTDILFRLWEIHILVHRLPPASVFLDPHQNLMNSFFKLFYLFAKNHKKGGGKNHRNCRMQKKKDRDNNSVAAMPCAVMRCY